MILLQSVAIKDKSGHRECAATNHPSASAMLGSLLAVTSSMDTGTGIILRDQKPIMNPASTFEADLALTPLFNATDRTVEKTTSSKKT
jgi:hypothetical protein